MDHRSRSEFAGCRSKTAAQSNNEPPCPREFLAQPTEFEKSGVLQHPVARVTSFDFSRAAPSAEMTRTNDPEPVIALHA